jgi:DNA polymerase-1
MQAKYELSVVVAGHLVILLSDMEPENEKPVLIIDALNFFFRAYCAYPTMSSTTGQQMGGCIGFLKTLQRLVLEQLPSSVYVAWEGGGAARRRTIYPDYKMNRKTEKLNRFYGDDIPESEENRQHQIVALLKMLKCVPVCQLYVEGCEGDDVAAYLCKGPLKDKNKIVVSSDRDLYQLLDSRTKVYSLHKKRYITEQDVLNDFHVSVVNFPIAKAMCGDPGDNIPGIKGLGFKTLAKVYPFLSANEGVLLQDVINYALAFTDESKIHRLVVENQDMLRRNWRLMYLDGSMLSASQSSKIEQVIESFKPRSDKMALMRILLSEGINDFNVDGFMYAFTNVYNKTKAQV